MKNSLSKVVWPRAELKARSQRATTIKQEQLRQDRQQFLILMAGMLILLTFALYTGAIN